MNYFNNNEPVSNVPWWKRDSEEFFRKRPAGKRPSRFSLFCKNRLLGRFRKISEGQLDVHFEGQVTTIGDDQSGESTATIYANDARFFERTLLGGTIGSADSFIKGEWNTEDLTKLIRILIRNMDAVTGLDRTWARLRNTAKWVTHQLRRNTKSGSRRNIVEHYDLGNDFYRLFLDPTMNYSSGIFSPTEKDMQGASVLKMDRICEKLQLKNRDHVLEIGTGWGGLAIHMVRHAGCRVTTATISDEQFDYATARVRELGLEDQINVIKCDYRDLQGKFDKVVSIEMIEAVGHQYFDRYFEKCSELLVENGIMLIQGIMMGQQNYAHHIRNVDFIRHYVFPGGCLPSIVAIGESLGRVTDLRMVHLEDITEHYVTTLQIWREQFHAKINSVEELGYDRAFIRMWHFYLCYCEAAFAEKRVNNVQLVLAKPSSSVDPANEYTVTKKVQLADDSIPPISSAGRRVEEFQR